MRILAVDTTTETSSAALLEDARLLAEVNSRSATSHSARLLKSIDHLLKLAAWDIRDIEGFAVAAGPGSFTGIRIGLSTIKALALASGKLVAPVSSLSALAAKLQDSGARLFCPLLDAKKGEVYGALFETEGGKPREIIRQGAYGPDALFARLPSHRVISFLGSGAVVYGEKIRAYLRDKARFSERSTFIAREVGALGYEKLREGRGVRSEVLEPIYYRRSQAEEKK